MRLWLNEWVFQAIISVFISSSKRYRRGQALSRCHASSCADYWIGRNIYRYLFNNNSHFQNEKDQTVSFMLASALIWLVEWSYSMNKVTFYRTDSRLSWSSKEFGNISEIRVTRYDAFQIYILHFAVVNLSGGLRSFLRICSHFRMKMSWSQTWE